MNSQLAYKQHRRAASIKSYQDNQISSMSPTQLILKVYDIAIVSVKKGDTIRAHRAIQELINSLDFEHGDIPKGLFRLYQFCQNSLRAKDSKSVVSILVELRSTWAKAFGL
jgi:flagellin-specific chaperone FliS